VATEQQPRRDSSSPQTHAQPPHRTETIGLCLLADLADTRLGRVLRARKEKNAFKKTRKKRGKKRGGGSE
jgi:hypothetical protein